MNARTRVAKEHDHLVCLMMAILVLVLNTLLAAQFGVASIKYEFVLYRMTPIIGGNCKAES